jgi:hypothetical protein
MTTTQTITQNGSTFIIEEMFSMDTYPNLKGLGWTHFAKVRRPNGRKTYYANLMVDAKGTVANSFIVLI